MRILAIETIDQSGSVAALEGERPLAIRTLDATLRSAATLAPAIVELLAEANWHSGDVQLVAVASGPGSFTGLRVGVTTAKVFAYSVQADVIGVNALEAIANQAPLDAKSVWTVLDALRDQVVAAKYTRTESASWMVAELESLLDNSAWLAKLTPGDWVSGPGLIKLEPRIPKGVTLVERQLWSPTAKSVGQLAWRDYQSGRRDDVFSLLPQYSRPSAAEEKLTQLRQQQVQQQQ
jgi:tRNA threonylcarbamoyladenosine biosynthesis protein TsaB